VARDPRWEPSDVVDDAVPPRPCPRSEPSYETTTDDRGRFTLAPLSPALYDVSATAAGYRTTGAGRHFELGHGQEIAGAEIRLEPGAVMRGRITTPKGDPVAGAEVEPEVDDALAVTDSRGAYRLAGLRTGRQTIWVVAGREDILTRSTSREVEVAPGENRLDLTLPPPGREVRGRVLAPDGTPAAGALLHPESPRPERFVPRPHTAADGSFVVHLPAGTGRLVATLAGYSPAGIELPPGEGPIAGAVIRLTPDRGLSVRILGWEPGDVPGGEIALDPVQESSWRMFVGQLQPDGRYRFAGLWPGEWKVTANVDRRTLTGRVTLAPGAEAHLDLTLPPKLAVHGRVVDEEGQPIAGAMVKLQQSAGWEFPATSGADGSFVVRVGVGSGAWKAWAERKGFVPTPGQPVEVAGSTPRAVELVMARGAVLRVRVRGVPADQVVQFLAADGQRAPFILQGDPGGEGLFRIAGLPPGEWKIEAQIGPPVPPNGTSRRWLAEVARQVTVGPDTRELTVDLTLPRGGLTLSGRVANAHRAYDIRLRRLADPAADLLAYPPAPDEPFRLTGLAAGSYLLQVKSPDGSLLAQQELELDADREVVVEIPNRR
jgi:hypothetical protein